MLNIEGFFDDFKDKNRTSLDKTQNFTIDNPKNINELISINADEISLYFNLNQHEQWFIIIAIIINVSFFFFWGYYFHFWRKILKIIWEKCFCWAIYGFFKEKCYGNLKISRNLAKKLKKQRFFLRKEGKWENSRFGWNYWKERKINKISLFNTEY